MNPRWLLICWACLAVLRAGAHPISLSTATVEVGRDKVTVRLEVMCEDFVMLYGYAADAGNYVAKTNLVAGMNRHADLLLHDFIIRDREGLTLTGKLDHLEAPTIPDQGVLVDDLMSTKVVYQFSYPLAKPPEYLTFQQRIGSSSGVFLPSVMQLTVRRSGSEPLPVVALTGEGEVQTFSFDWSETGGARQSGGNAGVVGPAGAGNMGIESYGAVYAFIYVEPEEVRIEILMPLLTAETWTEVTRKDRNFLEVAEQQAATSALKEFFAGHNLVLIDGVEVRPVVRRLDFYGVDFKDFAVAAEPRRLSAWTARLGAILSYSTKGLPNQVAITWDLFNPGVAAARAAVFAGPNAQSCRFTRYQPAFTWKNPGLPALPDIAPVQTKNPDEKARASIAETLLRNLYRAFDYREEKTIYDALARSVEGELLTDTYLQIHGGLLMQEQGGAVSRVEKVELTDCVVGEVGAGAFTANAKWRVTGTVEHWGHIHTRINAYEARLLVRRGDSSWKIHALEVGKQERVAYQLKVRKF